MTLEGKQMAWDASLNEDLQQRWEKWEEERLVDILYHNQLHFEVHAFSVPLQKELKLSGSLPFWDHSMTGSSQKSSRNWLAHTLLRGRLFKA